MSSPVVLTLRGKDRPLRFPVTAIEEFEREAKCSLGEAFAVDARSLKLGHVVTALHIAIKHGGSDGNLSRDRILSMLDYDMEHGRLALPAVVEAVLDVIRRSSAFKREPGEDTEDDDEGPPASPPGAPSSNPSSTNTPD